MNQDYRGLHLLYSHFRTIEGIGILRLILLAKERGDEVVLWGTGSPRREALYSEDCADALIYLMNN